MPALLAILKNKWVIISLIVLALVIFVYFKGKSDGKDKQKGDGYWIDPYKGEEGGGNSTPDIFYDPTSDVLRLYEAMDGWGTDEDAIWDVLESKNNIQLAMIYNGYKAKYGKDLFDDFAGDLDDKELRRAMSYFQNVRL